MGVTSASAVSAAKRACSTPARKSASPRLKAMKAQFSPLPTIRQPTKSLRAATTANCAYSMPAKETCSEPLCLSRSRGRPWNNGPRSSLFLVQLGDDDEPGALVLVIAGVSKPLAFAQRLGRLVHLFPITDQFDFDSRPFQFPDFNRALLA